MPPQGVPVKRPEDEPRLEAGGEHAPWPVETTRPTGAAAGGPPDFAALVTPHTQAMMRVAVALIGAADAEDAAQEALTRAWQAWSTLREVDAVRAWLLRITVNVCQQWRRRAFGRRLAHEFPLPADDAAVAADAALFATVGAHPGSSDHTGALDLRRALAHLPPDYRVVVVLRYYAGLDSAEIAAALEIAPVTVRTRLHRALGLLRERLLAAGVTPPASFAPPGGYP